MRLFNLLKKPDINEGINNYQKESGAILLDVRTPEEYRGGHIPGSKNLPLQTIEKITSLVDDKDTVLYVYCQSGGRSSQATAILQQMGYRNVNNIGGISAYTGKVER